MSAVISNADMTFYEAVSATTPVVSSSSHVRQTSPLLKSRVEIGKLTPSLLEDEDSTYTFIGNPIEENTRSINPADTALAVGKGNLNTSYDAFERRLLKSIALIEKAILISTEHSANCHLEQNAFQLSENITSKMKVITLLRQILSDHRNAKVETSKFQTANTITDSTSSTKNTLRIPLKSLPLFQWDGHVIDPNTRVFASVRTCIRNFEDIMLSNGSKNMDKDYLVAVPALLSDNARTWYTLYIEKYQSEHHQSFPSFVQFKNDLCKRFGQDELTEHFVCSRQLINIKRESGESVEEFIERFQSLRERAGVLAYPNFMLMDCFTIALPPALRSLMCSYKSIMPEDNKYDIDLYVEKARYFYYILGFGQKNTPDTTSNKRPFDDNDSGSSDKSSTTTLSGPSTNKRRKTFNKFKKIRTPSGRWCTFHRLNTHFTSRCTALKKRKKMMKIQDSF